MRKILITLGCVLAFLSISRNAEATVAKSNPITVTQPDGSTITIQKHGDEFHHWITDMNGNILTKDSDGYYRISSESTSESSIQKAQDKRASFRRMTESRSSSISIGKDKHFLVMLIEFSDVKFTVSNPNQAFWNLLNQKGYSANGGTGSVHDYYFENSSEKFDPVFDVIGPITVSKSYKEYGGNDASDNDKNPDGLLAEACAIADKTIPELDFSIYDIDKDGYVDNVFYYYAGYNEAEGDDDDTIWPHSWSLYYIANKDKTFDNVIIDGYACSSEYSGSNGKYLCGIGTFCHEFGHVLGLPDFYDTDYEENGQSDGLEGFSLMSSGNYNNSGRTPPYLNAEERHMLGWMDESAEWSETGEKTISGIQTNTAYRISTNNSGEYFQFEVRTGEGWDKYIGGKGLVVYHIDKSQNKVHGYTAASYWKSGYDLNIYSDHPLIHFEASNPNWYYEYDVPFPGNKKVTEFSDNNGAVAWSGTKLGRYLTGIKINQDNTVTATLVKDERYIKGSVMDSKGIAVNGASVVITEPGSATAPKYSSITGSDGAFSFKLDDKSGSSFKITVSCYGYKDYEESFTISSKSTTKNITLPVLTAESGNNVVLKHYVKDNNYSIASLTGFDNKQAMDFAIKLSSSILKSYAGAKIKSILFLTSLKGKDRRAFILSNSTTLFSTTSVTDSKQITTYNIDVSSSNLTVPSNSDLYIGYTSEMKNASPVIDNSASKTSGGFMYRTNNNSSWSEGNFAPLIISMTIEASNTALGNMGYENITIIKGGEFKSGDTFTPELGEAGEKAKTASWSLDGTTIQGNSVVLSKGDHTIRATLVFEDGRKEVIFQEIKVN